MKTFIVSIIRFYQKFISPILGSNCRFYPSCSEYFIQSVKNCGIFKGTFLGIYRILRCNPFSKGGIDEPHLCKHEH